MEEIGVQDRELEKKPVLSEKTWRRFPLITSCLFGSVMGFVIASFLIERWSKPQQAEMFFVWLILLVPLCSFGWHWLFFMRPDKLKKKFDEEKQPRTGIE
jgi:biotin transporter BioY